MWALSWMPCAQVPCNGGEAVITPISQIRKLRLWFLCSLHKAMQLVCARIRSQHQKASAASHLFISLSCLPLLYTHLLTRVWLSSRLLSFLTISEPCLTSCRFLGAAAIPCSFLCAPWLPAQVLNTVGAQTIFGGLICSHRLSLHALLLAQYGGHLQLIKEMEGIFIIWSLPVQSELSPTAGLVPALKLTLEARMRAG